MTQNEPRPDDLPRLIADARDRWDHMTRAEQVAEMHRIVERWLREHPLEN